MPKIKASFILAAVSAVCGVVCFVSDAANDMASTMRLFEEGQGWRSAFSCTVRSVDAADYDNKRQEDVVEVRRDGDLRQQVLGRRTVFDPGSGSDVPKVYNSEVVYGMGGFEKDLVRYLDEKIIYVHPNLAAPTKRIFNPWNGSPLFGTTSLVPYDIVEFLRRGQPELRQELVGDILCDVLEAENESGKITLWLSPRHKHAVVKSVVERIQGRHFTDGKPFGESDGIKKVVETLSDVQLMELDGTFVPSKAKFTIVGEMDTGQSRTTTFLYEISAMVLNPDFDSMGAFRITAPEGTPVSLVGDQAGAFVWRKGQLGVPVSDDTLAAVAKAIDTTEGNAAEDNAASTALPPSVPLSNPVGIAWRQNALRLPVYLLIAGCGLVAAAAATYFLNRKKRATKD